MKIYYLLQHGHEKLLDFGPSVEIDKFDQYVIIPDGPHYVDDDADFPICAFIKLISDRGMQSPKRQSFTVYNLSDLEGLRSLILAMVDMYGKATEPLKLFQRINIYFDLEVIKPLAERVQGENILELVRQSDPEDEMFACVFRTELSNLKLPLYVAFKKDFIDISGRLNLSIGVMIFSFQDFE